MSLVSESSAVDATPKQKEKIPLRCLGDRGVGVGRACWAGGGCGWRAGAGGWVRVGG